MIKSYKPMLLLYLLLFSVSFLVIGCSDTQTQKEHSQIHEQQDRDKELTQSKDKLAIDENPIPDENSKDLDQIAIGQSAAQVQDMFGKKYELLNDADTNTVIWRFDFTQNTDYKFPREKTLQNMNVDVVDLDGLKKGVIDSQLFIKFDDEDMVSSFSYYYKGSDNNIKVRHMFEDGTIKEERI
ncbi:hypothetical protein BRE01_08640 [Brevibacillus reuszeri]|uniref:Lipoprotein n=1 Tax=Brevibacillus reuszeri TaxID=54915 RepID=A0A0K9YS09_9BACL|nr:hypothetical protein [Brevibacillus reuszeri]KNB71508.1 hypothetical protein ADS79_22310 [Brevibacillus reuszeri]MED1855689.1 hypothetical protein [Brevibacillus reuszeri]GED67162.1 hypothetical protein BRE01_08640 [Brevibacillus reuszeri]